MKATNALVVDYRERLFLYFPDKLGAGRFDRRLLQGYDQTRATASVLGRDGSRHPITIRIATKIVFGVNKPGDSAG
ncbi:hypothetical protein [Mycobacterium uberis]|uniref:hypothetical protein n=1 Tax=Mycobacterium uberis TaxID=2162698 RepID=UPI000E300F16|nr:hypothetical protein [Mycobacterium uberis]